MSNTYSYIRASGIRKLVKENQKRCGKDFLQTLDAFVYEKILKCCKVWNGRKKTLDSFVARHILQGGRNGTA